MNFDYKYGNNFYTYGNDYGIKSTKYKIIAPTTEPIVATNTTPGTVIFEIVVIKPLNGNIISDGIGGNIFSIVIKNNTPKYPN